jgi:hypothetical protein
MKIYVIGVNTDIDSFWNLYSKKEYKECLEEGPLPKYMFVLKYRIPRNKNEFTIILEEMNVIFGEYGGWDCVDNNYFTFISKHCR